MGLDICWPIGYMFTLIGILLSGYGVAKANESISLGININLIWGVALTVFGLAMLAAAVVGARNRKKQEEATRRQTPSQKETLSA